jgi:two-component system CheB/CheR fusion protein
MADGTEELSHPRRILSLRRRGTKVTKTPRPVPVCGIGASAGGVEALQQFFETVPTNLGLAYVVVVHLAPGHKSELPGILSRRTKMPVVQVGDHDKTKLEADHVYVIAPDRKLVITDSSVSAVPFDQPRGPRMAIDLLFRSLAESRGDGFAIVLSGSGADGALGAKAVKEHGGLVLVQDPAEAGYGDMPRAVLATGIADLVLPVHDLAARLGELTHNKRQTAALTNEASFGEPITDDEEGALRGVFELLRKRTSHDFSLYKRNTVLRRLARRMQLTGHVTIRGYLGHLRADADPEVTALFNDLLISVTTFFRDPNAWLSLQSQVIGPLLERSGPDDPLRMWVPGCSTGEEAYTLAILTIEELERRKIASNFVIFASDLDETVLATARAGLYPHAIRADVSDRRLERFFCREENHYGVLGRVRDHIVFATHNLLRDPPFSRLHLISCRNLLIYLERELQEQVMAVFRYALRDDGYLFLGASEAADEENFRPLDKRQRIFVPRARPQGTRPMLPEILASTGPRLPRLGRDGALGGRSSSADLHLTALEHVAPPSLVIDERWNVLHVSPSAARFFQQGAGPPARRVTDLVRLDLRDELHTLVTRALDKQSPQLSPFVSVNLGGTVHHVAIMAHPRPQDAERGAYCLITFLDAGPAPNVVAPSTQEPSSELVRELREKLRQAEERIETMRDEHYSIHEDLRAANEELQSLNEEYRSTTEELETSKEELQSINEELQTVNQELKTKLEEVSRAHSDLENLMEATDVATLFLDNELKIKRFTPRLVELFNVRPRDTDRPIGEITHNLDYETLEQDARCVLTNPVPIEHEVRTHEGRVFGARLSPYRLAGGGTVDGVVISFVDVTAIKVAESALRASEARLAAELETMRSLHRMTIAVATAQSTQEALDHILNTAIALEGGDFGDVQLIDDSGMLRIVAQRGFDAKFLEAFARVTSDDATSCGRALRTRVTTHIEDVLRDPAYAMLRTAAVEAGFRAVQSTPLINRNGNALGVLSVHFREPRPYSEREKQLGELLGRQAADLIESRVHQDRVTGLNEALRQRTEELEASQRRLSRQAADLLEQDRNRDEFLAALGHELRNPMSAIHNSLSVLKVADETSERALEILRRQDRHMLRLVNDLLDITRVKHGRIRLERVSVDAADVARTAIESARPQAEQKRLRLEYEPPTDPLWVDADPERLSQILDNLLRNAVSYTDSGTISLEIRAEGPVARFTVRDTGIGIEEQEREQLFNAYQQRRIGQRSGGLGLGLALVRALVDAHGGEISVTSAGRGAGSAFSFTVPRTSEPAATPKREERTLPRSRHVLVVDDQHDVADSLGSLLRALDQTVDIAYGATQALELAEKHPPRVAFLDLSMPDMPGGALARRLRRRLPNLSLVAVTGDSMARSTQTDGFTASLLKPADADSLIALLHALPSD